MVTARPSATLSGLTKDQEEALFQDFPKVRYRQNPLDSVVAEVRFPPVLRIETEIPARFQDSLDGEFPLFKESNPIALAPPEIAKFLQSANALPAAKTFTFSSDDEMWSIALNRESLSLTCRDYTRWDDFRKKWERPFNALLSIYEPQFLVRIGLRYRDVISRERLKLNGVPWRDLLAPGIVGVIHTPLEPLLMNSWHQIVFKLQQEDTQVLLQHGLQRIPPQGEASYVFDSDFSTQSRREPQHAADAFNYFNKRSWYFFRTCIAERLHNAMQPESL